jgi:hypothetical protein
MKLRVFSILILLCGPLSYAAAANLYHPDGSNLQKPSTNVYDAASFGVELRRLDAALQGKPSAATIANLRNDLPSAWQVSSADRTYSISTKPLHDLLTPSSHVKAEAWIEHLQIEIERSQRPDAFSPAASAELHKILSARAFEGVRPPTALELFRQRVSAWLERMFEKLFTKISRHPIGAKILFWLLLIGGVGFVAFLAFRFISNRDTLNSFKPESSVVTSRSWQEWILAGRQAAKRGDFRDAVHSLYWAGIARLEEAGAVPRDRSRTPREYLRFIGQPRAGIATPENYQVPLAALTTRLERIWYANRPATSADFSDSLSELEALGCPLE